MNHRFLTPADGARRRLAARSGPPMELNGGVRLVDAIACPGCGVTLADRGRVIVRRLKTIRLRPIRPVCRRCGKEINLTLFS